MLSKNPLLDLKIQPRYSFYLASDTEASFVVDASVSSPNPADDTNSLKCRHKLSFIHGQPFYSRAINLPSNLVSLQQSVATNRTATKLALTISRPDTGADVAKDELTINSTAEVTFSLRGFSPRVEPYTIVVKAQTPNGQPFNAQTQLFHLPDPTDGRVVTKLDNLNGGLLVKIHDGWTPFFPYSFYIDSKWISPDPSRLVDFAKLGYNVLHVIPSYDYDWFDKVADEAEKVGLWIMYDMRGTWMSLADVEMQVKRYGKRTNLLLWYTADEPGTLPSQFATLQDLLCVDGPVTPLDSTIKTYDLIKSLDPYRPISLVLNCANYHFAEYLAGADILLSDPYPVATNTSWSTEYG